MTTNAQTVDWNTSADPENKVEGLKITVGTTYLFTREASFSIYARCLTLAL